MSEIFGQIVDATVPEQAVIGCLQRWMPTYLGAVERAKGMEPGTLEDVRAWTPPRGAFDHWPEEQLPCVVTVSAGTVGDPVQEGDGTWSATWAMASLVVIRAAEENDSNTLSKLYAAAMRGALTQHPGVVPVDDDALAMSLLWRGENYDDLPVSDDRTMLAARVFYEVTVDGVVNSRRGPVEPPEDPRAPQGDYLAVTSSELTLDHLP